MKQQAAITKKREFYCQPLTSEALVPLCLVFLLVQKPELLDRMSKMNSNLQQTMSAEKDFWV